MSLTSCCRVFEVLFSKTRGGDWSLAFCRADLDVTQATVQERRIGFVFQSYALFNHMTVAQNIAFGIRIRKLPIDADARCGLLTTSTLGPMAPGELDAEL